jgi:hypothetical protein
MRKKSFSAAASSTLSRLIANNVSQQAPKWNAQPREKGGKLAHIIYGFRFPIPVFGAVYLCFVIKYFDKTLFTPRRCRRRKRFAFALFIFAIGTNRNGENNSELLLLPEQSQMKSTFDVFSSRHINIC